MAQTLKFGGGTWATKKGSTLAYNDEDGNFKPLPFTYTGAGKGTRVNKEGLIEVVENDRPRIDYLDSEDGVFLLEKASTNLVTYSEDFSNSYWAKSNISILSNATISPDGSLNSDLLTPTASLGTHSIDTTPLINYNSQESTVSFFAKFNGYNISLSLAGTPTNWTGCVFDLENGVARTSQNSGAQTICTSKIENYGNGWYRCSVTFTPYATGTFYTYLGVVNSVNVNLGSYGMQSYTANGTSGVYIYGAQVESGNVASSYIPTEGNPQTRVQETASGSGNSEVFNDSQGVLFADISYLEESGTYRGISISDGLSNDNNRIQINFNSNTGNILFNVTVGGVHQAIYTSSHYPYLFSKVLIKYKANDFSFWINGFEVYSDNIGITYPENTLKELKFNSPLGTVPFYGKTKEIAYYDTVLTDLELETLTSYRTWEAMVKELNLNIIHNE